MAFASGHLDQPANLGPGVSVSHGTSIILTAASGGDLDFEGGLAIGRFAQIKDGVLSNMEAAATTIAGVVLMDQTTSVSDGMTYAKDITDVVNYTRAGLVTVEASGALPAYLGEVFCNDTGVAVSAAGQTTGAEFIRECSSTCWLVRLP